MLLRCALNPRSLDEQTAAELLTGPLGDTDALGLRRLRRALQLAGLQLPGMEGGGSSYALRDPRDPTAASTLPPYSG